MAQGAMHSPHPKLSFLCYTLVLTLGGMSLLGARAATLPAGFAEAEVASFDYTPTCMEFSPEGPLFVALQNGVMPVWKDGTQLSANFFADEPLVTDSADERGLLGIAFDPAFATNRYIYVYYTVNGEDHRNRVSRFTANSAGLLALPGSEHVIWEGDPHEAYNHNGGAIHFGADGKLYIATGDAAVRTNAPSLTSQHGKILRVNADGTIPLDNPFYDGEGPNQDAVWSLGLRNPFTFAIQPGTGRMFVNDVGEASWEEINDGGTLSSGRGLNYGWPSTEGDFDPVANPGLTRPFFAYGRRGTPMPSGGIITGGAFYNPATNTFGSAYQGDYFFADLGEGWIYSIDLATRQPAPFITGAFAVDLKVADDGSLYYLSFSQYKVYRVEKLGLSAPMFTVLPQDLAVDVGTEVTFRVDATGAPAIQWQRSSNNGASWKNIRNAKAKTYTFVTTAADDNTLFRAVATNAKGTAYSAAARLSVVVNNPPAAPVITVLSGLTNGKYIAGKKITFTCSGTDPDEGPLGDDSFQWTLTRLTAIDKGDRDRDKLPGLSQTEVSGTFSRAFSFIPAVTGPYERTDVAYALTLVARDAKGAATMQRLIIYPSLSTVTLASVPAGLPFTVDGQPLRKTSSFTSVSGFAHTVSAAQSQALGKVTYAFVSWSDSGSASHSIKPPVGASTYTATYSVGSLPQGWANGDIGATAYAGSAAFRITPPDWLSFTINGSGSLAGKKEGFHFVSLPATGDCTISAIITSFPAVKGANGALAGLMIRADSDVGSPFFFVGVNSKGSLQILSRDRVGQPVVATTPSAGNEGWIRITRQGGVVTAAVSALRTTWKDVGSKNTVQLPANTRIGLMVLSGGNGWQPVTFESVQAAP